MEVEAAVLCSDCYNCRTYSISTLGDLQCLHARSLDPILPLATA